MARILGLFFAAVGMIFLFCGSFSDNQFEDAMTLKIVVFTILFLLLCAFLFNARKCNTLLGNACHKHILMKTLVKLLLLGFASMVNFLIKYPRFNVHSSIGDTEKNKLSGRSQFNLYSMGSFSAFAVVISSKRQEAMELGVSDFLLGLTMDASMEIPGNRGPNLWYVLVAYVYCAAAIFTKSYLESLKVKKSISLGTHGNIYDLEMITVIRDALEEYIEKTGTSDPATDICNETTPLMNASMSLFSEETERNIPDISRLKKFSDIAYVGNFQELTSSSMSHFIQKLMSLTWSHSLRGFTYPSQGSNFSILVEINLKLSHFLRIFGDIPLGGEKLVYEYLEDKQRAGKSDVSEHHDGAAEQGNVTIKALLTKDIRLMDDGLRRRKNNISSNLKTGNMFPKLQAVSVYNGKNKLLMRKLE